VNGDPPSFFASFKVLRQGDSFYLHYFLLLVIYIVKRMCYT